MISSDHLGISLFLTVKGSRLVIVIMTEDAPQSVRCQIWSLLMILVMYDEVKITDLF